ncbi:heavy-metal-associated domain-containing protein [Phaeobacter sp. QD34_3]|jgi:copper chaperone|nr:MULTISPECIES: heavy-metal-associated domain-containing protein [Phaeobacter]MCK5500675.1 heavy-metal-associated domain-containing protein [Tritonibacter mobilis]MCZ4270001.1 heavy-metal-associated domain-containing protein [Rhodobacteraceae bacterium G21628-S1]MDE4135027.1 heavy-metal-associated domain-containing protein [Phaeobacter sp. QD34_3]NKX75964.1 heavy-metal-associated domain-containing protein [Rhodobacteraceae bacterium R_SAG3]MDE4063287.1 heavy-metal-associated domain-containing|tara:strand:+ start:849 stop:1055 length:207 start_codon:yes stop_codon:yes gene_type:complete
MEAFMIFSVPKMSCGHCTSAIESGIKAKDPSAVVTADLDLRLVTVQSTLKQATVRQAIADAGYDASAA